MKSYLVFFINGKDKVFLQYNKNQKSVKCTININKATEFNSKEEADKFIDKIKQISVNSPKLHIFEYINL